MKRLHKTIVSCLLAVAMLTISVFAADGGAGRLLHRSHTALGDGVNYYASAYISEDTAPQAGYALEIAPDSEVYPILMPCDTVWGGRTMDWMVEYAQGLGYHVVAAVNTAFYHSPGVPIGIAVENGELQVAASEGNAFGVLPDGSYYAARRPKVAMTLTNGDSRFDVPRLNKLFVGDALHVYTDDFSTVSTRVEEAVWAVRLRRLEGELTLNGTVTMEVTEVLPVAKDVPIGEGYMVLTALRDGGNGEIYRQFRVGDTVTLTTACSDETLSEALQVSGCGDILVENGVITEEGGWSHWIAGPNPRTLLGWKADGTLVVYVADGRAEGYALGLSLRQCAEEMLRLGCTWVVNMDGGGSSVLGVRLPGSNRVTAVNRPSDGWQRADAAYMLLVTDRQPDGKAKYLHLRENNLLVLPGQRVPMTVYATDGALYPAVMEEMQLHYAVDGHVTTEPYVHAPMTSGAHWVSVWGGEASGGGTLQVVTMPTQLQVTLENQPLPTRVLLERGETLQLNVTASHNGQAMFTDNTCIRYDQSVPLGTVDDRGNFTARAPHGTKGVLTLGVGGHRYALEVTVIDSRKDIMENKIKTAIDLYSILK